MTEKRDCSYQTIAIDPADSTDPVSPLQALRRQAEEKFYTSDERFRLIAENIDEVVFMADIPIERIFYISPGYERIWKHTCKSLYENPRSFLEAIHPEDRERVVSDLMIQKTGMPIDHEYRIIQPDGNIRWIWARGFPAKDETGHVNRYVGVARDITERKRMEEQIRQSLQEKELLLREFHHRVKNHLQVISSLFDLQLETINDPQAIHRFQESQNRILSMALIHDKLCHSKDLTRIDFTDYIDELTMNLFEAYSVDSERIRLDLDIVSVSFNIETGMPLALIVNELVSNALNHAFPKNREGLIEIRLHAEDDKTYTLIVRDNGIGLPEDFNTEESESLGLRLVTMLSKQLDGVLEWKSNKGTEFKLRFAELRYKTRVLEKR